MEKKIKTKLANWRARKLQREHKRREDPSTEDLSSLQWLAKIEKKEINVLIIAPMSWEILRK